MLVSATEMLKKAVEGKYAVGQFNINNLEWTKQILLTAEEMKSPVILGVSEGAAKYMGGFKTVCGMVKGMHDDLEITVPVAIHLDHGQSFENCKKAIDAGFTSVMFDGSHYPIEENVAKTQELVKVCEEKGMSLEAEVGSIGGEEDGVVGMGECADPNECKMIADLGVTMLAAGIGNIHGKYPEKPVEGEKLISVSGVGPKAAMSILSIMTPDKFSLAVCTEDVKSISKASGIGAKTAARIVLELKDKMSKEAPAIMQSSGASAVTAAATGSPGKLSEAVDALLVLGYSRAEAMNAIKDIDTDKTELEEIIRLSLKKLMKF